MTNRRDFLKKSAIFAAVAGTASVGGALSGCSSVGEKKVEGQNASVSKKRPNIVFFLADQHRRHAMSFWQKPKYHPYINGVSDPVHTPVLDAFAEESMVFSQCTSTTPVCSPHRGMMLSGMFPHANGVPWNCRADRDWALIKDTDSIARVLSRNDYSCGYIGKWHLDKPEPNDPANPGHYVIESKPGYKGNVMKSMDSYTPPEYRQGFDYWYAYGTEDDHTNPHYYDNEGKRHEPGVWATIHETDKAISYMKNEEGQREDGKPFCLFVSTHPPHPDYNEIADTDPEMFHKYYSPEKIPNIEDFFNRPNMSKSTLDNVLPANLPMEMVYGTPEEIMVGLSGKGPAREVVRYYYSSISGVDRQFGRLLQSLEDLGIAEDTIVVYTSDHGEMMGSHGMMSKSVAYEESMGIPMIVRYPAAVKPGITDVLMGSMDFMPTLLGLAGLADKIPETVDGLDLTDHVTGVAEASDKPTSVPYMLHVEQKGVRTDRYTFALNKDGEGILFDNQKDPYQMTNLFTTEKTVVKTLGKELGMWLRKGNDLWFQTRVNKHIIDYA